MRRKESKQTPLTDQLKAIFTSRHKIGDLAGLPNGIDQIDVEIMFQLQDEYPGIITVAKS